MNRHPSIRMRSLAVIPLLLVVGACGSASAPATNRPGASGNPATATAPTSAGGGGGGGASTTGDLCAFFTEDLAVAAVGGPVDAPTGGDVVPRPNGVYCHYRLAGNANTNVEAQFDDMTMAEFEQKAQVLSMTTPLTGIGEKAYQLDRSTMGVAGASVLAWADGRGVSVLLNRTGGDQAALLAAAKAIAAKILG
jgi:hypothetical protein